MGVGLEELAATLARLPLYDLGYAMVWDAEGCMPSQPRTAGMLPTAAACSRTAGMLLGCCSATAMLLLRRQLLLPLLTVGASRMPHGSLYCELLRCHCSAESASHCLRFARAARSSRASQCTHPPS